MFTHRLIRSTPFYFGSKAASKGSDGRLKAGTRVVLLRYDGGTQCRVATGEGLYVEVSYAGLAKLGKSA